MYLFLDDFRKPQKVTWAKLPENVNWTVVKNYKEFTDAVLRHGVPEFVSFDHDLAEGHYCDDLFNHISKEETGADCALWLKEYCKQKNVALPKWTCHSFNPKGKKNIESILNS